MNGRPFPLPEDLGLKRARPAVYLYRAAAAHLRSFVTGATPANAAKAMFGNDGVTDLVLKAASTPAAISGTPGWAQQLAGVAIYDLIQSTVSLSAATRGVREAEHAHRRGRAFPDPLPGGGRV
jgi:hypothetical protein